jgi:hypothetical protein
LDQEIRVMSKKKTLGCQIDSPTNMYRGVLQFFINSLHKAGSTHVLCVNLLPLYEKIHPGCGPHTSFCTNERPT